MREVTECIRRAGLPMGCSVNKPRSVDEYAFTKDASEYNVYWDVRKGLIPIVGAAREAGTASFVLLPVVLLYTVQAFIVAYLMFNEAVTVAQTLIAEGVGPGPFLI